MALRSVFGSRLARSCSPRPSQRSKYTVGVALRMRTRIAVQKLSRPETKSSKKKIRRPRSVLRHHTHGKLAYGERTTPAYIS